MGTNDLIHRSSSLSVGKVLKLINNFQIAYEKIINKYEMLYKFSLFFLKDELLLKLITFDLQQLIR
jgi:hypothetical protein